MGGGGGKEIGKGGTVERGEREGKPRGVGGREGMMVGRRVG